MIPAKTNLIVPLVVTVVALWFVPCELYAEPSEPFKKRDLDKNGVLTGNELKGIPPELFQRLDVNRDGKITAAEDEKYFRPSSQTQNEYTIKSFQYASNENPRQAVDVYLPKAEPKQLLPLIIFIHGGAWRSGSKENGASHLQQYAQTGEYICASIGYRLSQEAKWPAQIHDCKAAIRFLYANAKLFHIDITRSIVFGTSAGGHLAAMVAVTGNNKEIEGKIGKHLNQHSRVRAAISYFGPTDFLKMDDFPSTFKHNAATSPESQLIGAAIQDVPDRTTLANPIHYVDSKDPPIICIHGSKDASVPFNQSELLKESLTAAQVRSALIRIEDGGHGGFNNPKIKQLEADFFHSLKIRSLKLPADTVIPNRP